MYSSTTKLLIIICTVILILSIACTLLVFCFVGNEPIPLYKKYKRPQFFTRFSSIHVFFSNKRIFSGYCQISQIRRRFSIDPQFIQIRLSLKRVSFKFFVLFISELKRVIIAEVRRENWLPYLNVRSWLTSRLKLNTYWHIFRLITPARSTVDTDRLDADKRRSSSWCNLHFSPWNMYIHTIWTKAEHPIIKTYVFFYIKRLSMKNWVISTHHNLGACIFIYTFYKYLLRAWWWCSLPYSRSVWRWPVCCVSDGFIY